MTFLDVIQEWIVEIIGTIIFIFSGLSFVRIEIFEGSLLAFSTSIVGIILGLILMGHKKLAEKVTSLVG